MLRNCLNCLEKCKLWPVHPSRTMTNNSMIFVPHFNHVCNKMEWKIVSEDYDYNQEIATSSYGDMLHDTERNQKFGLALKKAIDKMHSMGRRAHVLDIGTGTGLLSMLAVKYGADSVVACEAFMPMAHCAVNIIEQNGFADSIKIVKEHSTALTVGSDNGMKHKANILVSEVFDTELIGEGAIKTFNHAHEHLLEDDCIVIPSLGTVYVQVVESETAKCWNKLKDWKMRNDCTIQIPDNIKNCPGAPSVHDIQLSQFKQNLFKPISTCAPAFRFDWSSKEAISMNRECVLKLRALNSGKAQVLFMWWDLIMDTDGDIVLSCAPVWEHPDSKEKYLNGGQSRGNLAKNIPWRDHWMQAVYFLTNEAGVERGENLTLNCYHDEFSFWFEVNEKTVTSPGKNSMRSVRPACHCGVHFSVSRTRLGAMNCPRRREFYEKHLAGLSKKSDRFVVFGDLSLLGPLIAKLNGNDVIVLESSPIIGKSTRSILEHNGLGNVTLCGNILQIASKIINFGSSSISIISEPFFRNSLLPWDNLSFWYMKEDLVRTLKSVKPNFELAKLRIYPGKAKIGVCGVSFDDLWKISRRLNYCEGFSMKLFDDLIENAKAKAESYVEPQPLWEYPGIALTEGFYIFELDFSENVPGQILKKEGEFDFLVSSRCDGVALWMEYSMDDDDDDDGGGDGGGGGGGTWLSTGPIDEIVLNDYICWDMFERQGVHLFRSPKQVNVGDKLQYEVKFLPESGDFNFKFRISSSVPH